MVLAYNSDFFGLLVSSYRRTVGAEPAFFEPGQQPSAPWLDERARHCVLAHNTDPDPRFIYANKAAQACFEYDWDEITSLPSRLSAEPVDREERQKLLDDVARQGFATGYSGLRIAKSGRGFRIEDGVVWQLIDSAVHGQQQPSPSGATREAFSPSCSGSTETIASAIGRTRGSRPHVFTFNRTNGQPVGAFRSTGRPRSETSHEDRRAREEDESMVVDVLPYSSN